MDYSMKEKNGKAMKYSLSYKDIQALIYNLILSSLVTLSCRFLGSYPFWFSSIASLANYFASISLPNFWSTIFSPMWLFIVLNVIVAYLVSESKLLGTSKPSLANDIYYEYVKRARILRRSSQRKYLQEEKKMETNENIIESENKVFEDNEIVVVEQKKDEEDNEEFQEAENDRDNEKQEEKVSMVEKKCENEESKVGDLPAEELNMRVEEFIARINKQRWIEARMLICGQ